MASVLVEKLDEAWKHEGLKSRMELFRFSLRMYLSSVGEDMVAGCLDFESDSSRLHH
jgi:metal-responsive CopG/Arc/MetJ family transcriptional regulator